MQRAQLAINSVSTNHPDLETALAAYAAAGFRNVEFVLPLVHDWLAQDHTVADLRRLLQRYDLRVIGGFQTHVECWGTAESRRANHAIHLRNAALIDELGGGTLVVGTDGPDQPSIAALSTVADVLKDLAGKLEDMNVTLAVEFNWSPLIKSFASAVVVAEKVNHPRVGILFDPAHYHTTPSKYEHLTDETVRWIKHVHLDDMRDKPGELSDCNADRVLPGEGVLDLPAIIARLEQGGYDGFFSIEMFNAELWQLPADEAARRCYGSLLPLCVD